MTRRHCRYSSYVPKLADFRKRASGEIHNHRLPAADERLGNEVWQPQAGGEYDITLAKQLAKELNILIVALSQLNRSVESRPGNEGKRPQLSDLRGRERLGRIPTLLCFIHRRVLRASDKVAAGNDITWTCRVHRGKTPFRFGRRHKA